MKDSYLGRKAMRRFLWLGVAIGMLLLNSCDSSDKKPASSKDVIGDEEYLVMSAVLRDWKTKSNSRDAGLFAMAIHKKDADSAEIARQLLIEQARNDSLNRRFGRLALYVDRDSIHSAEFFDTLVQRFGYMAYYVLRDSVNGKIAYDSLHRKYGDLTYYLVLSDNTIGEVADSFVIRAKEFKGMITPELIQSYNENNRERHQLERKRFGDSLVVDFIRPRDVDTTLKSKEWFKFFFAKYPLASGTLGISRVGFSADSLTALLNIGGAGGSLSGGGWFTLLRKTEGRWRVVAGLQTYEI
jgi:hypothetical protein